MSFVIIYYFLILMSLKRNDTTASSSRSSARRATFLRRIRIKIPNTNFTRANHFVFKTLCVCRHGFQQYIQTYVWREQQLKNCGEPPNTCDSHTTTRNLPQGSRKVQVWKQVPSFFPWKRKICPFCTLARGHDRPAGPLSQWMLP